MAKTSGMWPAGRRLKHAAATALTIATVLSAHAQLGKRMRERREQKLEASTGFPAKGTLVTAQTRTLTFPGGTGSYLIQPVSGAGKHPVVILLHGGTGTARGVWTKTSLPTLGLTNHFVMVVPDALTNKHWNDGRGAVLDGQASTADDIGYLKALIAQLIANDNADEHAIFLAGISNGGFMTIRFACQAGNLLRAAANIASTMPTDQAASCAAAKGLPWLSMNGTKDTVVPFNGMPAGKVKNGEPQPGLESADNTFRFFADKAGCAAAVTTQTLPDLNPKDGSTAIEHIRSGCGGKSVSTQIVLDGAGHSWPGTPEPALLSHFMGGVNLDIDAGTVIWEHFRQTLP